MQTPLQIQFVSMEHSESVEAVVRERASKLEKIFDGITSCHVFIDAAHRQHRKGNQYEVRLEVRIPGKELAVNKKPGDVNAHDDVYIAIRDAFTAMERQLKKWKRQVGGEPRGREAPLQGRIVEIYPDEGYGQIATTDHRLVYFHENSVVDGRFADLEKDAPVELVVQTDESEKGPQASTVRPIGTLQYVEKPR
ncbi:MAG: HPF/RaiA family ribosome-associated protein [Alphaproteobacteria bacterium]|nr:HPF/RaiA family ribosome-associated protein [Alphaproteobacteria bacterium]